MGETVRLGEEDGTGRGVARCKRQHEGGYWASLRWHEMDGRHGWAGWCEGDRCMYVVAGWAKRHNEDEDGWRRGKDWWFLLLTVQAGWAGTMGMAGER